MRNELGSQTL